MLKPIPDYLRLHCETTPGPVSPAAEKPPDLADLCEAFARVTGWPLRQAPGGEPAFDPDVVWSAPLAAEPAEDARHLRIDLGGTAGPGSGHKLDLEIVIPLADSLAALLTDLASAERALWQREAELAAGVPVLAARPGGRGHLADLLESLLASAAQAIDCHAAGLYLLDEATTEIKLRSCWGLARRSLTAAARPLAAAKADVEALAGHAVAIEDWPAARHWNPPERFPAAVCVPVSSATSVLGTLWLFCDQAREFTAQETNIAEIVAGRIATELEREMLAVEARQGVQVKRSLAAAERLTRDALPTIAPSIPGWDISAWTRQAGPLGGGFHTWLPLASDRLLLAVGDVAEHGLCAGMVSGGLRASIRAHSEHIDHVGELIERVNRSMWSGSAGDQAAGLFCASIEPRSGRVRYGWAGHPGALLLRSGRFEPLTDPRMPLGVEPETGYSERVIDLKPGEALVLFSDGVRAVFDETGRAFGDAGVGDAMLLHLETSAANLAEIVRREIDSHSVRPPQEDQTVMVVKRLP